MTLWTPGPWRMKPYDTDWEAARVVADPDDITICDVFGGPPQPSHDGRLAHMAKAEANARLIAEATAMADLLAKMDQPHSFMDEVYDILKRLEPGT